MQDLNRGRFDGAENLIGKTLPQAVEALPFDADKINLLRCLFGIEAPTDLNGLADADAMTADRS
jgi:hypothetical protein